jgi:hypothetical protein
MAEELVQLSLCGENSPLLRLDDVRFDPTEQCTGTSATGSTKRPTCKRCSTTQ